MAAVAVALLVVVQVVIAHRLARPAAAVPQNPNSTCIWQTVMSSQSVLVAQAQLPQAHRQTAATIPHSRQSHLLAAAVVVAPKQTANLAALVVVLVIRQLQLTPGAQAPQTKVTLEATQLDTVGTMLLVVAAVLVLSVDRLLVARLVLAALESHLQSLERQ